MYRKIGLYLPAVFLSALLSCQNAEIRNPLPAAPTQTEAGIPHTDLLAADPVSLLNQLKTDSLNTSLRLQLAGYYYASKDFKNALYHNQIVNRIDSHNAAALFNMGNIYYDTGEDAKAIPCYEKFLVSDPANCNVRCDLATCFLNLKKTDKAISLLEENLRIDPNHLHSHYNLAVILKQTGRNTEAEKEMKIYNELEAAQGGAH
jgi:tetratricopeptide (TPR) repeat protein